MVMVLASVFWVIFFCKFGMMISRCINIDLPVTFGFEIPKYDSDICTQTERIADMISYYKTSFTLYMKRKMIS